MIRILRPIITACKVLPGFPSVSQADLDCKQTIRKFIGVVNPIRVSRIEVTCKSCSYRERAHYPSKGTKGISVGGFDKDQSDRCETVMLNCLFKPTSLIGSSYKWCNQNIPTE